jgi:hypothetical protein
MPLLTIILVLVCVGVIMWLVNTYIPMQATIKKILNIAVVVIVVVWLLKATGIWSAMSSATI